jgi:hypothetical protein
MIRFVDFDGVLAHFDYWRGPEHLGKPVPEMIKKVRHWLWRGDQVTVYTARLTPGEEFAQTKDVEKTRRLIQDWLKKNVGQILPITNIKSYADVYYDDRCCKIIPNTGLTLEEKIGRMCGSFQCDCSISKDEVINRILDLLEEED